MNNIKQLQQSDVSFLTEKEMDYIASDLQDFHAVFYAFWQFGKAMFTEQIQTAAISFSKDGQVAYFMFNPNFWEEIDYPTRLFVICHEMLHCIYRHGLRMKDSKQKDVANIAMDIVVNHTITRDLNFDRNKIQNWDKYCWVETVFPNEVPTVSSTENYEFYYNKLIKQLINNNKNIDGFSIVDDHSFMNNDDGKNLPSLPSDSSFDQETQDKFCKKLDSVLGEEEKETLKNAIENHIEKEKFDKAGSGEGKQIWSFNKEIVKKKKQWADIIKKWYLINKEAEEDCSQWARMARRNAILPKDLLIPSEVESDDAEKKEKIEAWFFLDVSGSCERLKERFLKAARSVPTKYFKLKAHVFDDGVRELELKNSGNIRYGGGTSFSRIEYYIQKEIKNKNIEYPKLVVVITDGEGNTVDPQFPERWSWFLPKDGTTYYCNQKKGSSVWRLEDFE